MTVQSENERNKALVDEVFQGGSPGPPHELRGISASRLHSNRAQLPSLGRSTRRAAFFRDHLLPSVTDVFDFARFSYDNIFAEDAAAEPPSGWPLPSVTGSGGHLRPQPARNLRHSTA
jgi:hypothetical protein